MDDSIGVSFNYYFIHKVLIFYLKEVYINIFINIIINHILNVLAKKALLFKILFKIKNNMK